MYAGGCFHIPVLYLHNFNAMLYFLSEGNILLKDYGDYTQKVTADIKQHVLHYTESLSRPLVYLDSPKISKEETDLKCLKDPLWKTGLSVRSHSSSLTRRAWGTMFQIQW